MSNAERSPPNAELSIRPRETHDLKALREMQQAFAASNVTEEELQEEGRKVRAELSRHPLLSGASPFPAILLLRTSHDGRRAVS